jgi:fumarate reductase flavoprotein subunit
MGGVYAINCVAQLSESLSSTVIFNHKIWENAGKQSLISANPHLPNEGGTLHIADTFEALAEKIGLTDKVISARVLSQTVDGYNADLKNGTVGALTPSQSTVKGRPQPILTPPFYAAPTRAGITYTMGGIAIDGDARALRPDDTIIEGL